MIRAVFVEGPMHGHRRCLKELLQTYYLTTCDMPPPPPAEVWDSEFGFDVDHPAAQVNPGEAVDCFASPTIKTEVYDLIHDKQNYAIYLHRDDRRSRW